MSVSETYNNDDQQHAGHVLDDPNTTIKNRALIRRKSFLNKVYRKWYGYFLAYRKDLPEGKLLELGSGAGFLEELMPDVITSDIMPLPDVDMQLDAQELPFGDAELAGIFMIDVLHHMQDCRQFFKEADRCLVQGGKLVMIEPANTPVARFIYQNFHHEEFDPSAGWTLPSEGGPLSNANGAIPWIVFDRDIQQFKENFSRLQVETKKLHTPMLYLLSGGLSRRSLVPGFSFPIFNAMENIFSFMNPITAMFQLIVIKKNKE